MGCNCNKNNNTQKNRYYSRANTLYKNVSTGAVPRNVIHSVPTTVPKTVSPKAEPTKVVAPKTVPTNVVPTKVVAPKVVAPKAVPTKVVAPKVVNPKPVSYRSTPYRSTPYRSTLPNGGYATAATYQQHNRRYKPFKKMSQHELQSWDNIHKMAVNATTVELKDEFSRYIEFLRHNFPCPKCRPHIKKYMHQHPIKSYYNIIEDDKDIGIAKWSWEFHNDVNKRLFKRQVSWEDFKKKYLN